MNPRSGSNPVTALKGIETSRRGTAAPACRRSNPVTALKGIETESERPCSPKFLSGSNPVTALKGIETLIEMAYSPANVKFKPSDSPERD